MVRSRGRRVVGAIASLVTAAIGLVRLATKSGASTKIEVAN